MLLCLTRLPNSRQETGGGGQHNSSLSQQSPPAILQKLILILLLDKLDVENNEHADIPPVLAAGRPVSPYQLTADVKASTFSL